jgi:hypothetical protein
MSIASSSGNELSHVGGSSRFLPHSNNKHAAANVRSAVCSLSFSQANIFLEELTRQLKFAYNTIHHG